MLTGRAVREINVGPQSHRGKGQTLMICSSLCCGESYIYVTRSIPGHVTRVRSMFELDLDSLITA